jgi:beta-carotene 3-hydroxylase
MPSLRTLLVVLGAFLAMEPLTYLVHRFVMHGPGLVWHRSHHVRSGRGVDGGFERNDWYPVVFASSTIAMMLIGSLVPAVGVLLPIGAGITAYGLAYLFVHDVYIHRRLVPGLGRRRALDRLAGAHAVHHRFGTEPYGMLVPVIPARLRERARAAEPATERSSGLVGRGH